MMTETELSSPTSTTSTSGDMALDSGQSSPKAPTLDDKASYRKSNKPMMEKKRRARINSCLSQLKALVLHAMKKDNSQYSKLEKADILELTVKHLKNVQRFQTTGVAHGAADAASKYRAGFNECASEVMRYMAESQGVDAEARTRILAHLASLLSPLNSSPTPILPAPSVPTPSTLAAQTPSSTAATTISNNINNITVDSESRLRDSPPSAFQAPDPSNISVATSQASGLQLVSTSLPGGQVALVLAPQATALTLQQSGAYHHHQQQPSESHPSNTRPVEPDSKSIPRQTFHRPSPEMTPPKRSFPKSACYSTNLNGKKFTRSPGSASIAVVEMETSDPAFPSDPHPGQFKSIPKPYSNPSSVKNLSFAYHHSRPRCPDQKPSMTEGEDFGRTQYSSISSNDDENMEEETQPVALISSKTLSRHQEVEKMETNTRVHPSSSPLNSYTPSPLSLVKEKKDNSNTSGIKQEINCSVSKSNRTQPNLVRPSSHGPHIIPPNMKTACNDETVSSAVYDNKLTRPTVYQHAVGRYTTNSISRNRNTRENVVKTTSTWRPW
ncbi:hypothetical protein RRG08_018805 [Elysia crispata]|uniref:Uncharacterized protein n=1 Tax=Elysia crispata TaxID=231223 RepID=A0AAE0ZSM6_9GAST|nr:hypothetical protein RRG08_018805 [Elysia crispata]